MRKKSLKPQQCFFLSRPALLYSHQSSQASPPPCMGSGQAEPWGAKGPCQAGQPACGQGRPGLVVQEGDLSSEARRLH